MAYTTRYHKNLRIEGNRVISYTTHVATISGDELHVHGYWSPTTSKHINHVADVNGLTKVDKPRGQSEEVEDGNPMKAAGLVALFGELLCETKEDKNAWKLRMLKAGAGEGLDVPEDWDTLSEEEKERRLDKVIEVTQGKAEQRILRGA